MIFNLKKYKETQALCEIYLNFEDLTKFLVGIIINYDNDYCIVKSLDEFGKDDGLTCFLIKDIIKIQTNTLYLQNIVKLRDFCDDKKQKFNENLASFDDFCAYAQKAGKICSFEICESNINNFYGIIYGFNTDLINIKVISEYGIEDGLTDLDKNNITTISINSKNEIKLDIL